MEFELELEIAMAILELQAEAMAKILRESTDFAGDQGQDCVGK